MRLCIASTPRTSSLVPFRTTAEATSGLPGPREVAVATALLVALNYVGVGGSASAPGPRARVLDRVFPGPPVSLPFSWRSEEKQGSDGDQRVESTCRCRTAVRFQGAGAPVHPLRRAPLTQSIPTGGFTQPRSPSKCGVHVRIRWPCSGPELRRAEEGPCGVWEPGRVEGARGR